MKSNSTMFGICTSKARALGPRTEPGTGWYGYFMTVSEIRTVFLKQGFSPKSRKTIPKYIDAWKALGNVDCDAETDPDMGALEPTTAVWFRDLSPNADLVMEVERSGAADPWKVRIAGVEPAPMPSMNRMIEDWGKQTPQLPSTEGIQ